MNKYQEQAKAIGSIPPIWIDCNRLFDAKFNDCGGEYFQKNMIVQVKIKDIDNHILKKINVHENFLNNKGESFSININTDDLHLNGKNWLYSGRLINC